MIILSLLNYYEGKRICTYTNTQSWLYHATYIHVYTSTFCMAYLLSIPTISKRYKNTWTWFCKQQLNVLSYLNVPYMNVYKYLELHVHV